MRNFYVETYIDDRATPLKGGPRRKDGGFTTTIKMLVNGEIAQPLRIEGSADEDGRLTLKVYNEWEERVLCFKGGRK